ncbi:hypothetical protein NX059_011695 [Plenodomus lindquistii]|nr:hypothetical protein NX059_011695 [Plenodomus lindquistii]
MPAKIVYGRKKTTQQTSFTKLLSPEKASAAVAEGSGDMAAGVNWRTQLELAAREDGGEDSAGLEGLESRLGGLRIDGNGRDGTINEAEKEGGMQRNYSKPRRARGERKDGRKAKEAAALIEGGLERSMGRLEIGRVKGEGEICGVEGVKKVGRPRKALGMRDANVVKELNSEGKAKGEEKRRTERSIERRKKIEETKATDLKADTKTTQTSQSDDLVRAPRTPPKKKPKRRVECTPASRPQPPQLLTPEPTPEPDDIYTSYISPLLPFSDQSLFPFATWASELTPHFMLSKIAEASFSEVYRLSCTNTNADVAEIREDSVLKVVALKTPPSAPYPCQLFSRAIRDREAQLHKETEEREERDEYKSKVEDVLTEVRLLQTLTPIPGFTRFRSLHLLRGSPSSSPSFCAAWSSWNRARARGKKSVFPDPSKKASYDDNQLWAVIEMGDAGSDVESLMEKGGLSTIWEVWDVFWGVVCAVGKGEEGVQFEHRDLHLGNICVRREGDEGGDLMETKVTEPLKKKMRFSGLEATVIDYTLSRADISSRAGEGTPSRRKTDEGAGDSAPDVAYLDLNADPALFQGDASEEYQYEIYRYMRGLALFDNPLQQEPPPPTQTAHQEDEEQQEQDTAPLTPRRSPRKNTHIRFDGSDDDDDDAGDNITVLPRRSPRKHNVRETIPETPEPQLPSFQPPTTTTNSPWRTFHPRTNLIWLHFLLHKLLSHMRVHATLPSLLSASQLCAPVSPPPASPDDAAKIKKKAGKLYKVLERVSEMLCPVALGREGSLGSAKELVVFALEERWVRVGDVEGV